MKASLYAEWVVDLLEMKQLRDHDPSESPLIVLPCRHVYTIESLDGLLRLDSVYERDPNTGKWIGTKRLDSSEISQIKARCPECFEPVHHARRYGRVINTLALLSAEKKFLVQNTLKAKAISQRLQQVSQINMAATDKRPSFKQQRRAIVALKKHLGGVVRDSVKLHPLNACLRAEDLKWKEIQEVLPATILQEHRVQSM